ncbi:type II secretion system protein [Sulfurimonas sp.]|jgi:prepilin-type N-terminal cleavage/methylation domain-containing protein|uniref:pilus assembly FimT family protein n=1 Tax=Sulfurimonas sp. TaxID=2022749 RepID=UPI002A36A2B8|nr:type II secretion system protein [Sulfurimonas sp.]MDY0123654.1 type II secretion system protein [Sulfurimonas sp.]
MKKAFTMLELVFVIVVIGILAAVVIPRIGSNKLQEAAIQVVSHIRYTQHLALVDDKFNEAPVANEWYKKRWQIQFESGAVEVGYMIYSDINHGGNADAGEFAIDPLSRKTISEGSDIANLKKKYGITQVQFDNTCRGGATGELSFDFLGRPYFHLTATSNNYENLLTANCDITLTSSEGEAKIRVHPETGYTCVLDSAGTDCI